MDDVLRIADKCHETANQHEYFAYTHRLKPHFHELYMLPDHPALGGVCSVLEAQRPHLSFRESLGVLCKGLAHERCVMAMLARYCKRCNEKPYIILQSRYALPLNLVHV